jgi:hypothetical protein
MTALVLSPAELHGFCPLITQRDLGHWCHKGVESSKRLLNSQNGVERRLHSKSEQNKQNTGIIQI